MRNNVLLLLIIICSVVTAENINPFLSGQKSPFDVAIIAHRGANAYAPENTIPAFVKALEIGANMIELDVHVAKDGVVIVFHDDTLAKCTNVEDIFPERAPYFISDFTYAELQQLDAGSWFLEKMKTTQYFPGEEKYITAEDINLYGSGQVKIPTLKEVLLFIKEKSCYLNIEIKSISQFYPEIVPKVIHVIEETQVIDQVIISSFDHYAIFQCKELNKKIATAALCGERIFEPGNYCKSIFADAANINMKTIGFDSISFRNKGVLPIEPLIEAQKQGISINVWTVNDPQQIEALLIAGISGVISDYPNRVKEAIEKIHNSQKTPQQNNELEHSSK